MLAGDGVPPRHLVRRPEQKERQVGACTKASLPPPVTMHLDHQGPPVTYSEATLQITPEEQLSLLNYQCTTCSLRLQAHEKEKEAA